MKLPLYADAIVKARQAGKRPADPVIVSLGFHGLHRKFDWPVVVCPKPDRYDLEFLADLECYVGFNFDDAAFGAKIIRECWTLGDAKTVGWFVPNHQKFTPSFLNTENQLFAIDHYRRQHLENQARISA